MKLSKIIKFMQEELARVGDVEVFKEDNDGRSTSSIPFNLSPLTKRVVWKGHSAPPRWYFGGY